MGIFQDVKTVGGTRELWIPGYVALLLLPIFLSFLPSFLPSFLLPFLPSWISFSLYSANSNPASFFPFVIGLFFYSIFTIFSFVPSFLPGFDFFFYSLVLIHSFLPSFLPTFLHNSSYRLPLHSLHPSLLPASFLLLSLLPSLLPCLLFFILVSPFHLSLHKLAVNSVVDHYE